MQHEPQILPSVSSADSCVYGHWLTYIWGEKGEKPYHSKWGFCRYIKWQVWWIYHSKWGFWLLWVRLKDVQGHTSPNEVCDCCEWVKHVSTSEPNFDDIFTNYSGRCSILGKGPYRAILRIIWPFCSSPKCEIMYIFAKNCRKYLMQ